MPRDVMEQMGRLSRNEKWQAFVKEAEKKAPKRKLSRVKAEKPEKMRGTLFAKRNTRMAIKEAAKRGVTIIITYKKVTTGETKKYEVIPIEWKFRKLRAGYRKVLYAQDTGQKKQIKNFVQRNIQKVAITDRKLKPKGGYPIRIK